MFGLSDSLAKYLAHRYKYSLTIFSETLYDLSIATKPNGKMERMMRYWATAADEQCNVIFNQVIEADSLDLAMEAAKLAVPVEHHGSIDVTDERGNTNIEPTGRTPTPWRFGFTADSIVAGDACGEKSGVMYYGGDLVCESANHHDRDFIVRACNAHEQMKSAIEAFLRYSEKSTVLIADHELVKQSRAALAAAEA